MIYLVTGQPNLFEDPEYKVISIEESLQLLDSCKVLQADSETTGRDAHLCDLLCFQLGSREKDFQIVIDCTTVSILKYKGILESKYLIFQNAKFDLQFLYNYKIIPRKVYDTMIVEQLLYLGYPPGVISYSLASIAERRLGIYIDKEIRGQIIWRGLDREVILYAANDVKYLEDIKDKQIEDCKTKECLVGAKLECDFVPVIAYLEWCGIKLDESKWRKKMEKDKTNLETSLKALNDYCIAHPKLNKWITIERQGDLFSGFDSTPKFGIDWQKDEAKNVFKELGFDISTISKRTNKESESVQEKVLSTQKGIDDKFLKLYFDYQGYYKVITSFGQGHLNAINPKTGRIHTVYRQLGAASGRMSCGSSQSNDDLAKYKKIKPSECKYPNLQQLPSDEDTRSAFVSEEGYNFVSCDYAALESRLGADIYNEPAMINEYLYGSGDIHSLVAKACFPKELEGIEVKDIKSLRPDLRKKAKGPEFAMQFGGSAQAIMSSLGCSLEEAEEIADAYWKGFSGIAKFKSEGSKAVRKNGYVLMCKYTGHKMYWWDHDVWLDRQKSFTPEFWEAYRNKHKGTGDKVALEVKEHFQAAAKWDRMALNSVTQGTGIICLKSAMIEFFNWIILYNMFGEVKIVALVHDEACIEYPKELENLHNLLAEIMEKAAAKYCKSLPIPAEASVGNHWIH